MSTSLVVTDEVFIADDDELIELTFGCDTSRAYDALVKLSNVVGKNAKCQNHMEDILNNLKLFVETNVGKLTRLTTALDESNRTLQGQVARLTEELRVVREQSLRKEEYEVDIRRVKSQLSPCVTFLDEIATKKNYGLDVYIRDLLRNDIPSVFLKPFLGEVQQRIAAAVDTATNQMTKNVHTKHEDMTNVLARQTERVDKELRQIQAMIAEVVEERAGTQAAVDEALSSMTTRVDDSLSTMRSEWTSQSQRVSAELQSLDERHNKVVELLGFREAPGSSPFRSTPAPVTRSDITASAANVKTNQGRGDAAPAVLDVSGGTSNGSELGASTSSAAAVPWRSMTEGRNSMSLASTSGGSSTAAAPGGAMVRDEAAASASVDGNVEALFYAELEAIGRRGSMMVRAEESTSTRPVPMPTEAVDPQQPSAEQADHVAAPSGGGVRLISRGKSIANISDPVEGTGLFSSQLFQNLVQHVTDTSYAAVCSLEERFKGRVDTLVQRWETALEEKVDLAAVRRLLLDAPAPRDNHLYHLVDGLQKQLDALKRLKVDVQEMKHRVDNKADTGMVAVKANQNDLDAQKKEMERSLQEISASILQINHVMRKSEVQMKLFHESLADQGLLLPTYKGGVDSNAGSDGGTSPPVKSIPHASKFPGGGRHGVDRDGAGSYTPTKQGGHHRGANSASGGRGQQPSPAAIATRGDAHSARTYNDSRPVRKPVHNGTAAASLGGGNNYSGPQHQQSLSGGASRHNSSAGSDRGGGPSELLPSLHEVVFDMNDQHFAEHKRRSEKERKLVVAPRPPSK